MHANIITTFIYKILVRQIRHLQAHTYTDTDTLAHTLTDKLTNTRTHTHTHILTKIHYHNGENVFA